VRPLRALGCLLAAALAGACAKPPPDLDAEPAGAIALPLGQVHADTLDCDKGDCADWYKIAVPGEGKLFVDADPAVANAGFAVQLVDAGGAPLAAGDSAGGKAAVRLHTPVSEGAVLVKVVPTDAKANVAYAVTARFKPAPPPPVVKAPEPRFETKSAAVLEVEGDRTAHPAVLIDAGQAAKLAPGMRGRLVDKGHTIGQIVVQDVYPDGSRARVDGPLSGQIGPHTTAEIDVPIAAPAGPESPPEK